MIERELSVPQNATPSPGSYEISEAFSVNPFLLCPFHLPLEI